MKSKDNLLTILIFAALIAGVLVGQFGLYSASVSAEALAQRVEPFDVIGKLIFIRPLMMLIIPLVFVSVVVGVTSIGNPQKLGVIGGATLVYYFSTMLLAVMLGLVLVSIIQPGVGVAMESVHAGAQQDYAAKQGAIEAGQEGGIGGAFLHLLYQMIPDNPLLAAVEGKTLSVVVVSILLGLALVMTGKPAEPVVAIFDGLFQALIKLVVWIIWLAPIGVFCLVAARVGEVGLGRLAGPIGWYALTVVIGLLLHGFGTLPLILAIFGKTNAYKFCWQVRKPIITAFSTASSSATLPITIEESVQRGGCSKRAANFVLPLGATVNMDGTALYQAVAVSFLFQMMGTDLTITQQLVILVTATLAAIGAAGIPSSGLVTMAIVITAVNASLPAISQDIEPLPLSAIGIILGIDRILDMCRTAVNVWGDTVGARLITRLAPDVEDERKEAYG